MQKSPNLYIYLASLYDLGGMKDFIHVEDIFVDMYEKFPNKFSWKTKNYPDLKKTSKAMQEAEDGKKINPVPTIKKHNRSNFRMFSSNGKIWFEKNIDYFKNLLSSVKGESTNVVTDKYHSRDSISRKIRTLEIFKNWSNNNHEKITNNEIYNMLGLLPGSPIEILKKKMNEQIHKSKNASDEDMVIFLENIQANFIER